MVQALGPEDLGERQGPEHHVIPSAAEHVPKGRTEWEVPFSMLVI